MKILITGSSGYIGTQLCKNFNSDESIQELIGLDLAEPRTNFSKLVFYNRDCNRDLSDVFEKHVPDIVIHLVYVLDPLHDSEKMYRINVGSMENVLSHIDKFGVKRLVVTSSGTAYGALPNNPEQLKETDPLRGKETGYQYAYDKVIVEEKLEEFGKTHPDVEIVIARPAVVAGPNLGNFISRYLMKPLVPLVKEFDQDTQLIHEEDIASALYHLALQAPAGAYNLGPPDVIKESEFIEIMGGKSIFIGPRLIRALTTFGWFFRIKAITEAPSSLINYIQYRWVVDGSKIERETDFRYKYSTMDAMNQFAEANSSS